MNNYEIDVAAMFNNLDNEFIESAQQTLASIHLIIEDNNRNIFVSKPEPHRTCKKIIESTEAMALVSITFMDVMISLVEHQGVLPELNPHLKRYLEEKKLENQGLAKKGGH